MRSYDEFVPNEIYPYINFSSIKSELISLYGDHEDYGSILVLKYKDYHISINKIGKITIFYNVYDQKEIKFISDLIERTFKNEIKEFHFVH